jgi:hypothetical protein
VNVIGVPRLDNPPLLVMLTDDAPSLALVTVNVCAAVEPAEKVSEVGDTDPALVAAGVTTTDDDSAPFGVTVNVVATPFTPVVGPLSVNAVAAPGPVSWAKSPVMAATACTERRIALVRRNAVIT